MELMDVEECVMSSLLNDLNSTPSVCARDTHTHTRLVTMGSMSRGSFRARVMRSAFRVRILWKRRRM